MAFAGAFPSSQTYLMILSRPGQQQAAEFCFELFSFLFSSLLRLTPRLSRRLANSQTLAKTLSELSTLTALSERTLRAALVLKKPSATCWTLRIWRWYSASSTKRWTRMKHCWLLLGSLTGPFPSWDFSRANNLLDSCQQLWQTSSSKLRVQGSWPWLP